MPDTTLTDILHLPSGEMAIVPDRVEAVMRAAEWGLSTLKASLPGGAVKAFASADGEDYWAPDGLMAPYRPYKVEGKTLVLPVSGLLMKADIHLDGLVTGYGYIEQAILRANRDDNVDQIALVLDSPGGYVLGSEDAVSAIQGSAKPVTAFVKHMATSAAYLLAAHASKIVATPGGLVGQIGVISTHISYERALENAGLNVTVVYEGATKADGHPYKDLPEDALSRYKAQIKAGYSALVASVATGRGMKESDIFAMESRYYRGEEALGKGLVDEVVESMHDAWNAYVKTEAAMPDKKTAGADGPDNTDLIAKNEADTAKAVAEAKADERERIKAIMQSEEAKGREDMAVEMAVNTDLPAEQAVALLAKSPKAEAANVAGDVSPRATSHFEEAMQQEAEAPVGTAEGADEAKAGNPLLASWSEVTGVPLEDDGDTKRVN